MLKAKHLLIGLFGLLVCAGTPGEVSAGTREELLVNLHGQLDVRELSGRNDGPEVKAYLNHVGLNEGYAWCAAFVSFNLDGVSVVNPRSAWSPDFARAKDMVYKTRTSRDHLQVLPGDVFSLYFTKLKRVGHVGFIVGITGDDFITIEGNTNNAGSREGDGVYRKRRAVDKVYAVTRYIIDDKQVYRREAIERYRHPTTVLLASVPGNVRLQKLEKDGNNDCRVTA